MSVLGALGSAALAAGGTAAGNSIQGRMGVKYGRKMRDTAYQQTMTDMRKAGLNPILAYKSGPTPASAMALNSQLGSQMTEAWDKGSTRKGRKELLFDQARNQFFQAHSANTQGDINMRRTKLLDMDIASNAMDLASKRAGFANVIEKQRIKSKTKWLNWVDRFLTPLERSLGVVNSAASAGRKGKR